MGEDVFDYNGDKVTVKRFLGEVAKIASQTSCKLTGLVGFGGPPRAWVVDRTRHIQGEYPRLAIAEGETIKDACDESLRQLSALYLGTE